MIKSYEAPKEPAMVLAHFNKSELNVLDHMQGKKLIDPKTGVRHYRDLGDYFKDPHVKHLSVLRSRSHLATGGQPNFEKMKKEGRNGDNEMAYIPRDLANHFDQMMGKKSINPNTRHREYWGLGEFFKSMFRPFYGTVANNIKPITQVGSAIEPYVNAMAGATKVEQPAQNAQNDNNEQMQDGGPPPPSAQPSTPPQGGTPPAAAPQAPQTGVISPPMGNMPNISNPQPAPQPNPQNQLQPGIAS